MDPNQTGNFIGDKSCLSQTSTDRNTSELTVQLGGEEIKIEISPSQTILEALIEADHSPPYSCMEGACTACMAKVTQGLLHQENIGVLSEENIKQKEALTCQATVFSKSASINYDYSFE